MRTIVFLIKSLLPGVLSWHLALFLLQMVICLPPTQSAVPAKDPCNLFVWDMVRAWKTYNLRRSVRELVESSLYYGDDGYYLLAPVGHPVLLARGGPDPHGLARCAVCRRPALDHVLRAVGRWPPPPGWEDGGLAAARARAAARERKSRPYRELMRSSDGSLAGLKIMLTPSEWVEKLQKSNQKVRNYYNYKENKKHKGMIHGARHRRRLRRGDEEALDFQELRRRPGHWVHSPWASLQRYTAHRAGLHLFHWIGIEY